MKPIRKIASVMLMAATGGLLGGITGGIATFYVYFIGSWIGAPVGAIFGGWLGGRMALRNSLLLFVACYGGMEIGIELAKVIGQGKPKDNILYGFLDVILSAGMVLIAGLLCLMLDQLVSFESRRRLAFAASCLALCWILWNLYHYAYVWQPS